MKINHYALFNQPISNIIAENGWQKLRTDESETDYYIPTDFEEYKNRVGSTQKNAIAIDIIEVAKQNNLDTAFSIGVGMAGLEYHVKKQSTLKVIVSDYNDAIERIASFHFFDVAFKLNALEEKLPIEQNILVIFPRIDTEFTDEQLALLIKKCYDIGIKIIYFIPAQLLTPKVFFVELKILAKSILLGKKRTFCGYSRTEQHFRKLFTPYYLSSKKTIEGRVVFVLEMNI